LFIYEELPPQFEIGKGVNQMKKHSGDRRLPENCAPGRQPRRPAFWKAQHMQGYVSISKMPRNAGSRLVAQFSSEVPQ
jgi:hypothetical protein